LLAAFALATGIASPLLPADEEPRFLRGDANVDGRVTLADVFAVLRYSHAGVSLKCMKSGDVNDDGKVQLYDALELLSSIFYRHSAPPPPFVKAGVDPTPDSLTCRQGLDAAGSPVVGPRGGKDDGSPLDPAEGDSPDVDCDDHDGGPDLEFIHFRGSVLVTPGETRVRAPIFYFSPNGGVEGVTISLFAPPEAITLERIEYSSQLLRRIGASKAWSHTYKGQRDQGYLSSTIILSVGEEPITLPQLQHEILAYVEFSVSPQAPVGSTVKVIFEDTPGERGLPPLRNEVSRKAAEQPRHFCGLRVEVVSGEDVFIRGDANRDRQVNIVDAVAILRHLFVAKDDGAPAFLGSLRCPDAADVDDDGLVLLTDAFEIVQYLFLHGSAPKEPFPAAGRDPTPADTLPCAEGK